MYYNPYIPGNPTTFFIEAEIGPEKKIVPVPKPMICFAIQELTRIGAAATELTLQDIADKRFDIDALMRSFDEAYQMSPCYILPDGFIITDATTQDVVRWAVGNHMLASALYDEQAGAYHDDYSERTIEDANDDRRDLVEDYKDALVHDNMDENGNIADASIWEQIERNKKPILKDESKHVEGLFIPTFVDHNGNFTG